MRISTQTIRTFVTIGLGQSQVTAITFVGCGVRALANALALYPAASSPKNAPNDSGIFADKRESGQDVGGSDWRHAVVCQMRGIDLILRSLRRLWLRMVALLRDTLSPAGAPHAGHAIG